MTVGETALELGIPLDTAKDRLRRARAAVRVAVARIDREVERV